MSIQARPHDYAAAIYDLAFEPWTRQLRSVQRVLSSDAALRAALYEPGKTTQDKLDLLGQALPDGLRDEVRRFLGTLFEVGQFDELEVILAEFERLIRRRPESKVAQVTTAIPLTENEQEVLRAKLTDRFGPDLEFQFDVDESLIGGVYLRVGDRVIDGSLAGKLAALRDRLTT